MFFGDGVNIASSIEASGEPGGIYISGRVYEDIKNKTDITAEFIGEKNLKNIDHPVKVYALRGDGPDLKIKPGPKSNKLSWLKEHKYPVIIAGLLMIIAIAAISYWINSKKSLNLNNDLIAVAIFENQTGDESLDPVGRMTSDWITQGIASTGLVSVMPSFKLKTINEIHQNMDGIRLLAKETTAQTIITGVFYKEGSNLQFHAHIVDVREEEILNVVGSVSGPADDPLKPIEHLRQKLMGALAANFDENFKNYSDRTLNPPLFEAYREFLTGVDYFFNYKYENALKCFLLANKTDSSYLTPLLWVNNIYLNIGEHQQVDSITRILDVNRDKLSAGEQFHLDWLIALNKGNKEEAWKASSNAARYYFIYKYQQCMDAYKANRPYFTIEKMKTLEHDKIHFPGWSYEVLAQAYHMTGEHEKELQTAAEGRKKHPELFASYWNELKALAALGRIEDINNLVTESLNMPTSNDWTPATPGWLMLITAQELIAHGYNSAGKDIILKSIVWYNNNYKDEFSEELGAAYYIAGQWDKSEEIFSALLEKKSERIELWGYLGIIAAHRGDTVQIEKCRNHINDLYNKYNFGKEAYWKSRIAAVSGDKEMAVQLLCTSFSQGLHMWGYDIPAYEAVEYESLRDYKPFQDLIKPKE